MSARTKAKRRRAFVAWQVGIAYSGAHEYAFSARARGRSAPDRDAWLGDAYERFMQTPGNDRRRRALRREEGYTTEMCARLGLPTEGLWGPR